MTDRDDDDLSPEEAARLAGSWPPTSLDPALEDAVVARLRARGLLRPRRRTMLKGTAAAAAALLCLALGAIAGRAVPTEPQPAGSEFLLLLYGAAEPAGDAAAHTDRVAEYSAWARGLAAGRQLVSAGELTPDADTLEGAAPLAHAAGPGDPVGFFVIRARDRSEARRVSLGCPHLRHGGRVEVRPLAAEPSAQ